MKTTHLGPCIATALLVVLQPLVALLPRPAAAATPITLSDGAYALIAERVAADRASFFVYLHADSGFNHGFPSGLFGTARGGNRTAWQLPSMTGCRRRTFTTFEFIARFQRQVNGRNSWSCT
jgi:hypothetical protein